MAYSHNITSYEQIELVHPYAAGSASVQQVWYRDRSVDTPLLPADIIESLLRHHASIAQQEPQAWAQSTRDTSSEPALPATAKAKAAEPENGLPNREILSTLDRHAVQRHDPSDHSKAPKSSPEELIDWSSSPPSHQHRLRSSPDVSRTNSPLPAAEPPSLGSSPPQVPRQLSRYSPPPDSSAPESLEHVVLEPYNARRSPVPTSCEEELIPPTPLHFTRDLGPDLQSEVPSGKSDEPNEEVKASGLDHEPSPRVVIHQTPFAKPTTQKSSSSARSSTNVSHIIHQTPYESLRHSMDASPSTEESRRRKRVQDQRKQAEHPVTTPEPAKVKKRVRAKDKTREQAARLQAHLKKRLSGNFKGNPNPYQF